MVDVCPVPVVAACYSTLNDDVSVLHPLSNMINTLVYFLPYKARISTLVFVDRSVMINTMGDCFLSFHFCVSHCHAIPHRGSHCLALTIGHWSGFGVWDTGILYSYLYPFPFTLLHGVHLVLARIV